MKCLDAKYYTDVSTRTGKFHSNVMLATNSKMAKNLTVDGSMVTISWEAHQYRLGGIPV